MLWREGASAALQIFHSLSRVEPRRPAQPDLPNSCAFSSSCFQPREWMVIPDFVFSFTSTPLVRGVYVSACQLAILGLRFLGKSVLLYLLHSL